MKAVHTKILKVSLSLITEQEFLRNSNEFCVVESIDSDSNFNSISFASFDDAKNIALKKNQIVMSKPVITNENHTYFIFIPDDVYQKKVVESKRILVEVSDKKYDECLAEIENYKRQDQLMNWTSRNPDYYNISGWNFDVKPDEIIRIID